jgi:(S)-mandelate dehydrogenase
MSDLSRAVNIEDLRRRARARTPRAIFDFFDGGAEDEVTLRANRSAYERVRLLPRILVDVAEVDTRTTLFGVESRYPLAIAPMGAIGAGRNGADLALARAAKAYGIPYTLATPATTSIERIATEVGGRLWFQLYVLRDVEFREKLIERAHAAGYEALLVTVDVPVGGKRERDTRNDFVAPFRPSWRNSRDIWCKPGWVLDMLVNGIPRMENLHGFVQWSTKITDIGMGSVGRSQDASFDWDGLKRVRDQWPGKLLVKGVERAGDAERIVALGGDGLVVSNHGGRQLDGASATLDALPEIARAVGAKLTVLVDGGVRRGVDILKARALGAQAVLAGRAPLFGVMAGGEPGARRALEILTGELQRAMQLCGARSIAEITPDLVARS